MRDNTPPHTPPEPDEPSTPHGLVESDADPLGATRRVGRLPPAVRRSLPAAFAARLATTVIVRSPFVYLNTLSAGLGWSTQSLANLLGVRELVGLLTIPFGRWVDRGHERTAMLSTMAAAAAANLAVPLVGHSSSAPATVAVAILLTVGAATTFFVGTAQTAWIGHAVPFSARARAIGLVEATWGCAFLVGVPIIGWAIALSDWRALFVVTGIACAAGALWLAAVLPRDVPRTSGPATGHGVLRSVDRRQAAGLAAFFVLQPAGQMMTFAAEGRWLDEELGFGARGIAAAHFAIGGAEVAGTVLVAALADRLGARHASLAGTSLAVPAAAVLVVAHGRPVLGLVALAACAICLEFAFVSAMPLVTELDRTASGTLAATGFAVVTVSRAVSAPLANVLYDWGGFTRAAQATVALMMVATATLTALTRQPPDRE